MPGAHEMALVSGEIEAERRDAAVGNGPRLLLAVARKAGLEVGDVALEGRRIVAVTSRVIVT